MATVRYTTVNGEVIAEKRNGVRKFYVPDPLGSTVALLDNTQAQTDTFSYWPYGEVRTRTETTATPFQFLGTWGYYRNSTARTYVRARSLDVQKGTWTTQDPLGSASSDLNLARYVINNPTTYLDAFGLDRSLFGPIDIDIDQITHPGRWKFPIPDLSFGWGPCAVCAGAIRLDWWSRWQHPCNNLYTHCMMCCTLARYVDSDCAKAAQHGQNSLTGGTDKTIHGRWVGCNAGLDAAGNKGSTCDQSCSQRFKWKYVRDRKACQGHLNPNDPDPKGTPLPSLDCCGNTK